MTAIFDFVAGHAIKPMVAGVFKFDDLPKALQMQDEGGFDGKIVVVNE